MSTRISRQSFEFSFIRQRMELHPQATAAEIAASLELDGIKVSAEQVRQVMDQTRHTDEQIDGFCYQQKRGPQASKSSIRAALQGR